VPKDEGKGTRAMAFVISVSKIRANLDISRGVFDGQSGQSNPLEMKFDVVTALADG